eukprot:TRINITY_DN5101_c0_g1_i1.p1 TRINITY_DN5101_c0_g1~~TRINITY_DN5101_c0_g1_i1.p1  ORF type:complete len:210 (+),score=46.27 TRINITY_DN5101_c0_g1_i1:644-1273(+)
MGNLFGKKEKSSSKDVSKQDRAILELKMQRDNLHKHRSRVKKVMEKESELARQLLKEQKRDRAKLCIQRKRHQEKLLEKAEGILQNIQEMIDTIEFAQCEAKVMSAFREGSKALQALQKEIGSVEEVEKLMEDTEEAMAFHEAVSQTLSRSLTPEDDVGIEEQLAAWEAQDLQERLTVATPAKQPLPLPEPEPPQRQQANEDTPARVLA